MFILFWLSQTWPVTLRIQEKVFSGRTVLPDSKETELEGSDQEASPSASKKTKVVSVPCLHMEVCSYSYFWWCGYSWGPWCHLLWQMSYKDRSQKLHQGLVSHGLTAYLCIFNLFKLKACVHHFLSIFIFKPNDSPLKTMKNAFYFI